LDAADRSHTAGSQIVQIALERQPMADALNQLAAASGLEIVFYSSTVEGLSAPAVRGPLSVRDALERLLAGTRLEYEFMDDRRVTVRQRAPASQPDAHTEEDAQTSSAPPETAPGSMAASFARTVDSKHGARELEEVIVTARRRE